MPGGDDRLDDDAAVAMLARSLRDLIVAGDHLRRMLAARDGLGLSEFIVISQLYFTGPAGPGELTRNLGLTAGTMTALLDHLEQSGMVARGPHPTDRRRLMITMTDKGREVHTASFGEFVQAVAGAFKDEHHIEPRTLSAFLDMTSAAVTNHAATID